MCTRFATATLITFFSIATALAADALKSAHSDITNAQGQKVGTAQIRSTANGVKIKIEVANLPHGQHGIHIHTVGKCEAPAFSSTGGHFNPTSAHHGIKNAQAPPPARRRSAEPCDQ